jgi:hypothetical protein
VTVTHAGGILPVVSSFDANINGPGVIPEPTPLALISLGLLLIGCFQAKSRNGFGKEMS